MIFTTISQDTSLLFEGFKMAFNTSCTGETTFVNLQHPEILSREQLIDVLKARCIAEVDINDLQKHELVELFYRHVTPLPQRINQLRRAKRRKGNNDLQSNNGQNSDVSILGSSRKRIHSNSEDTERILSQPIKSSRLNTVHTTFPRVKIKRKSETLPSVCSKMHAMSVQSPSSGAKLSSPIYQISKPKAVKLNRKSLGFESVKRLTHPQNIKETISKEEVNKELRIVQNSKSNNNDLPSGNDKEPGNKKTFQRVTITWP